jgi:hypothetical protein
MGKAGWGLPGSRDARPTGEALRLIPAVGGKREFPETLSQPDRYCLRR